jgi:DNA polymerase-1
MGVFYRAYFAIRNMTAPDGAPTNGLFGFIRMVEQLRRHWQPTHLAVVLEGGIPAHRLELVPEYKANRPSMPDEMRSQIPLLHQYLEDACSPAVRLDGWEADDVMASLACQLVPQLGEVLLATSDKDLMQVIGGGVSMVTVAGDMGRVGEEEVRTKTGVGPTGVVDWLALVGDSADNIPGVRGVSLREKLLAGREAADRNRAMVRLHTDLAGLPDADALRVSRPDVSGLLALYDRLGFKALAKDLREPELF